MLLAIQGDAGSRHFALTVAPQDKKAPAPVTAISTAPHAPNSGAGVSTAPALQQSKKPGAVADVKPGDTLWGLAEQYFGKGNGARYGEIASANKGQIKNPDLIYPKQQFAMPENKAP